MKLVNILVGGLAAVLVAACSGEDGSTGSEQDTGPATSEDGASSEELVAGKALDFKVIEATKSNASKGVTLLRTAAEYKAFFGVKAPSGLFPKSWVVHYSMGTKSTGGYSAEITKVTRGSATGHRLSVAVTTHSPGPSCQVTQALTNPQVAVSFAAQKGVDTAASKLDAQTELCGGCVDVSDCPKIKMPCKACDDGSTICPQMTCEVGECSLINTECPVTPPPAMCGGIANLQCPKGLTCVDDPKDSCNPNKGGADCSGICVVEEPKQTCGGFANLKCPKGYYCGEDTTDSCDPKNGGADCSGVCLEGEVCGDVICGEGTTCCNPLMNICTKPGMVCAQ